MGMLTFHLMSSSEYAGFLAPDNHHFLITEIKKKKNNFSSGLFEENKHNIVKENHPSVQSQARTYFSSLADFEPDHKSLSSLPFLVPSSASGSW